MHCCIFGRPMGSLVALGWYHGRMDEYARRSNESMQKFMDALGRCGAVLTMLPGLLVSLALFSLGVYYISYLDFRMILGVDLTIVFSIDFAIDLTAYSWVIAVSGTFLSITELYFNLYNFASDA